MKEKDLVIEQLQNELEEKILNNASVSELKYLREKIMLLKAIDSSRTSLEELYSRKTFLINNEKYRLLERIGINFNILMNETRLGFAQDDLRFLEEDRHFDEVMDRIDSKKR